MLQVALVKEVHYILFDLLYPSSCVLKNVPDGKEYYVYHAGIFRKKNNLHIQQHVQNFVTGHQCFILHVFLKSNQFSCYRPVRMPIQNRRYFFNFRPFYVALVFHFFGSAQGLPSTDWRVGAKRALPLEPPPLIFAWLLGHQFVTLCENFMMIGGDFFRFIDSCRVLFLMAYFDQKQLNILKVVKIEFLCKLQITIMKTRLLTCSAKPLSWIYNF